MNRATPQMRNFAKRLMSYETAGNHSVTATTPVALQVCEKLQPQLVTLMGSGGFQALLARALALGSVEVPGLHAIEIQQDGSLAGQLAPSEAFEGGVVLLAQLLGLLVAFIGEVLTWQLVHEVWPNVPLNDLFLSEKAKYENAR
jgi:hypothetical protein